MRSKILFAAAFGILLAVFLQSFLKEESATPIPETTSDLRKNAPLAEPGSVEQSIVRVDTSLPQNSARVLAQTNLIEEKIIELSEMGAREDAESFRKIIASLSDPNPQIREAALDATIQFGNRDAIPVLEELAAKTEDSGERVKILEAAKYLALPSFSEIRAQRRANSSARGNSLPRN